MNTHETYVSLEAAKLLKEAGFDWDCLLRYWEDTGATEWFGNTQIANPYGDDTIAAPTLEVAQRWLREVKFKSIEVTSNSEGWVFSMYNHKLPVDHTWIKGCYELYNTYEEALEAGIKKCLNLILENDE